MHLSCVIMTGHPLAEQSGRAESDLLSRPIGVFLFHGPCRAFTSFELAEGKDPDQRDAKLGDGIRRLAMGDERSVDCRRRLPAGFGALPLRLAAIDRGQPPRQCTDPPQIEPGSGERREPNGPPGYGVFGQPSRVLPGSERPSSRSAPSPGPSLRAVRPRAG